jgi:hypothetical protein
MRLCALLFTVTLIAPPARAQQTPASSAADVHGTARDRTTDAANTQKPSPDLNLPVSLDKIKEQLEQSQGVTPLVIDQRPTFRVQIRERRKIEELLATLNFKAGPTPAGGIYMLEQNRVMFNPVDHTTMQPFGAFGQGQLLTLLIENLVGHYLADKTGAAITKAERAHAEAQAREDVRVAVGEYCNAQPNAGAGLQICSSLGR